MSTETAGAAKSRRRNRGKVAQEHGRRRREGWEKRNNDNNC
jgi:hypothetical protein